MRFCIVNAAPVAATANKLHARADHGGNTRPDPTAALTLATAPEAMDAAACADALVARDTATASSNRAGSTG